MALRQLRLRICTPSPDFRTGYEKLTAPLPLILVLVATACECFPGAATAETAF